MSSTEERKTKPLKEAAKTARVTIKTSLNLAKNLWREVKLYAVREGLTLTQVVEAALRKYLEIEEAKTRKEQQ